MAFILMLGFAGSVFGNEENTLTVDRFLSIPRVADPQLSPDGKWVAYTVSTPDLAKNSISTQIWLVGMEGKNAPRPLTTHAKGARRPRWSPDGKHIAFLSSRSGSSQIWLLSLQGGEPEQMTTLSTGVGQHVWSPTGDCIAFTSAVYPEAKSDEENESLEKKRTNSGVEATVTDSLMFRHWDSWREGKRSHLFLITRKPGGREWTEAKDLTPGDQEIPPISLGGPDYFDFSPDGKELAYSRGADPSVEAWSTNADLWVMNLETGERRNLTEDNKGWDGSPSYSPDGKWIAYKSLERDGFESDLNRVFLWDRKTGQSKRIFEDLRDHAGALHWSENARRIFVETQHGGETVHYQWDLEAERGSRFFSESRLQNQQTAGNGSLVVGIADDFVSPPEIAVREVGSDRRILTSHGSDAMKGIAMPRYQSAEFEGSRGRKIQAWLLFPPGYQEGKKYPFLYFIHGGPQGAWTNRFHWRWNLGLMAAHGYVVMAPNPHGSTGFGQEFMEQISGDWGGAVYEDLMKGVDWALEQGFVDEGRMGAAGGSYGGYMVNWILGHTDRFAALVSHAGVYNLESFYGATEELWFPEWDLRGMPWDDREGVYQRFSPHRFAARFKTPTLVIHGQLDYRVPVGEGFQLFTALQRQGVKSRLLYFPDEGHWVHKPKNAKLWNEEVLGWFDRFLRGTSSQ